MSTWGPTQGRPVACHDLEVGVIVNLDISRGRSAGGRERDRSLWANIREEAVSVPRCLPLGSISSVIAVDESEGRDK